MEEVQRAYGVMAEQYIELISSTQVHADDLALLARHLSIRPGAVLDVGCGPGHLTAHLRSLEVASPTTHMRRGHWRRQRVGPIDDWCYEQRFIPPVIVNPGTDGDGPVTVYVLPEPPNTDSPPPPPT